MLFYFYLAKCNVDGRPSESIINLDGPQSSLGGHIPAPPHAFAPLQTNNKGLHSSEHIFTGHSTHIPPDQLNTKTKGDFLMRITSPSHLISYNTTDVHLAPVATLQPRENYTTQELNKLDSLMGTMLIPDCNLHFLSFHFFSSKFQLFPTSEKKKKKNQAPNCHTSASGPTNFKTFKNPRFYLDF